jgi:hypothetical protein
MGANMQPSPEFHEFGRWFIQDIDWIAPTLDEMYDFVLGPFEGAERVRLREFIDGALHESVTDDELQRLWDAVDADIYFPTVEDLRAMLKGARDRL